MKAFILTTRPHREADCILTLFSYERGKECVRAPGVRWQKAKLRGHLQPLRWADLRLASGRRPVVVDAEEDRSFPSIRGWEQRRALCLLAESIDTLTVSLAPCDPLFFFCERAYRSIVSSQVLYPLSAALFWILRILQEEGSLPPADGDEWILSEEARRVLQFLEYVGEEHAQRLNLSETLSGEVTAALMQRVRSVVR